MIDNDNELTSGLAHCSIHEDPNAPSRQIWSIYEAAIFFTCDISFDSLCDAFLVKILKFSSIRYHFTRN